ncbi:MAG: DUF3422 domain-containing protein [Rubrivivax sp.]|nr:DUF3422 domain-containing protein [Rubrivivax sp.]
MAIFPPDHPERYALALEAHARPPEPVQSPARASYVAVLVDADDRARERAHLEALCLRHGVQPPPEGASHFRASFGPVRLKWERHGEFSGYTVVVAGASTVPFAEPAAALLPADWLAGIPGPTVAAVNVEFIGPGAEAPEAARLAGHFSGNTLVGSQVAEGAATIFTDFRIHNDGCTRFLIFDHGLTQGQCGRMLQRLAEIEAYRLLALLALPIARRQSPRTVQIERELATLTDGIAQGQGDDEDLLHDLTRLAAEVESGLSASQFRFGACRAYFELVTSRIADLRETRLAGVPTIQEFMARRFTPAVATCTTLSQRLHDLSERVAQTSSLLSTRVDITRERQNQALLASMDRRAKLQLRLQQTVEGLSVAAIAYYVAGLVGYLAKALKSLGLPIDPDLVVGLAIPVAAVLVLLAVRRARRRVQAGEASELHAV